MTDNVDFLEPKQEYKEPITRSPLHTMEYDDLLEYTRAEVRRYVRIDPYKTPGSLLERIRLRFIELYDAMNSHTKRLRMERETSERGREVLLADIMTSIHNREEKYKEYVDKDLWDAKMAVRKTKADPNPIPKLKRISEDNCRRCAVRTPEYSEFLQLRGELIGLHQKHINELHMIESILVGISNQSPKRKSH